MVAATPLYPVEPHPQAEEHRILLYDVPWSVYVVLRDTVNSPALRMTYLEGSLEIMRPSRAHEVNKKQIARFVELFCLDWNIPLYGYGQTTFRTEERSRGLEPDECYARGCDKAIPDFALEVVQSTPLLDKLEVYRGLEIDEVWIYEKGAFRVVVRDGDGYVAQEGSRTLPEIDLNELASFVTRPDQHQALVDYRDALRARARSR